MFYQLLRSQCRVPENGIPGTVRAVRRSQPEDAEVRRSLNRRQLLVEASTGGSLRVPLMARWLRRSGTPAGERGISLARRRRNSGRNHGWAQLKSLRIRN